LAGDLNAKHPVRNSKASNPLGLKILDLFVNCNFEISAPQYPIQFVPNGRGYFLDIVGHKDVRLSEVRVLHVMDSDHQPIIFYIFVHTKSTKSLYQVEKITDWERFQSVASALVSPRVNIYSFIKADKADGVFAESIALAYRLSTEITTISDSNRRPYSLERLLKHSRGSGN
jgi:hypothetical protein